jgi:nitrous oxidase accessory protein
MRAAFILLVGVCVVLSSWGRCISVGKGKAFSSIRSALSASHHGDTLLVHGGVYTEGNILVDKRVLLLGIGMPVLDGAYKYEVLTIKADGVVVRGFCVRRSGMASLDDPGGIKVMDANDVVIEENRLIDNFFGIYIQYGKHCIIRNNVLEAYGKEEQQIGNGIHCWKSDSLQIIHNSIQGHRDGVYFEFVSHAIIWRNLSCRNLRYGLHFMFSNDDAYVGNIFRENGAGVAVMYSRRVSMMNNCFEQNWGDAAYGLLLKEISDSHLQGNRFIDNTSGIWMEGTSRMQILDNLFKRNGWAMQVQASCMDNAILRNNFMANTFDIGTNGSVVLNTLLMNYWQRYEGYDLDRNGFGDIPFRPLTMFSAVIERKPAAMLLFRSFLVQLLDRSEKVFPSLTPENFIDTKPSMKPWPLW